MKPHTRYTKSGRINIAYQVFGSGPIDLVYIPGWVSNIDWMWACPELVSFLRELSKIARVILFDKRGTGLSDRVVELSTLEERMDDIRAVMDAVGSQKAVLFGHSEGGSVSALFAATYPNRTISLITFGIFAKRRYAPEYPWAPTDEERQKLYNMIENSWGSGDMNLESLAPSKANDEVFMDWLASYFRSGASPSAAMVLTKMNTNVDIIDILGSIKVPTLIMQRNLDIDVKIEEGKFIAERIAGARFVELEGDDHLFWVGDSDRVLKEMKTFIIDQQPTRAYEEKLLTLLAIRVLSPGGGIHHVKEVIAEFATQYRGNLISFDPDMMVATFEGPSKAVHCSIDMMDALRSMGTQLTIGIHIKEGLASEAHQLSNNTEAFMDLIMRQGESNHILITQTVKYLLSGAGVNCSALHTITDPASGDSVALFSVTDHLRDYPKTDKFNLKQLPKSDSFLENVLQSIDDNLSDESFSVEMLCQEIGISERQLQRKLKAITNKSPVKLISSVRLHRAKELLMTSDETVAEIAFQTGFSSPSYFSKCFKRAFGHSPSELLQQQY